MTHACTSSGASTAAAPPCSRNKLCWPPTCHCTSNSHCHKALTGKAGGAAGNPLELSIIEQTQSPPNKGPGLTGEAGGAAGNLLKVHVLANGLAARVHLQRKSIR